MGIGFIDEAWFPEEPLYSGHGSTAHSSLPRRKVSIRTHHRRAGYREWSKIGKAKK